MAGHILLVSFDHYQRDDQEKEFWQPKKKNDLPMVDKLSVSEWKLREASPMFQDILKRNQTHQSSILQCS